MYVTDNLSCLVRLILFYKKINLVIITQDSRFNNILLKFIDLKKMTLLF